MNLNISNIDPETRGKLYRLQAERDCGNLAETLKILMKDYYDVLYFIENPTKDFLITCPPRIMNHIEANENRFSFDDCGYLQHNGNWISIFDLMNIILEDLEGSETSRRTRNSKQGGICLK